MALPEQFYSPDRITLVVFRSGVASRGIPLTRPSSQRPRKAPLGHDLRWEAGLFGNYVAVADSHRSLGRHSSEVVWTATITATSPYLFAKYDTVFSEVRMNQYFRLGYGRGARRTHPSRASLMVV